MKIKAFTDLADRDSRIFVVKASLQLLPPEAGGKTRPIKSGYRPNHNFGDADNRVMYIGQVEFSHLEELMPGDTAEVTVRFISGEGLKEQLLPGRTWRIQEGLTLVGEATILEPISEE